MREIKFRARCFDTGRWLYGQYFNQTPKLYMSGRESGHYIVSGGKAPRMIDRKTLGQFTGLKDKNGCKIYESDLVEHDMEIDGVWKTYEASKVVFDERHGIYCFEWDAPNLLTDYRNLEVIGNIYENPELLEESK